jgi:hypothetical protein
MGANVTVTVKMPDGTPVVGAQLEGINHDAWAKSHKEWKGTTDEKGQHIWSNLDTGTLGDRYTFKVDHTDPSGGKWLGEVSERIRHDMDITIVVAKSADGSAAPEKKNSKA